MSKAKPSKPRKPPKPCAHPKHPMQPVIKDARGVMRFHENAIVRALLDRDVERGRIYSPARSDGGLNWIAAQGFTQADQEQFAQLIGYAISGYHELPYVSDESCEQASVAVELLQPGAPAGCRDAGCAIHGGPLFDADTRPAAKRKSR